MGSMMRDLMIFRALLDYFPHSFYVKEYFNDGNDNFSGGNFVRVSKVKASHYGLSIKQILGKTDYDLLPLDQAQRAVMDDLWVMQNRRSIKNRRERITHPNGEVVWMSVTKMPLMYDDAVSGIIGFSIDITQQVKAEERAARIAALVHQIHLPLATISAVLKSLGPRYDRLYRMLASMLSCLKKINHEKR
ncbi:PAS domain-containing protein [Geomonas sp. RF6]|uniref:PAS domain-containing protein n=1 Tax=Geomonas sp. RF6 TaxID=2897342 RepID=UPI001E5B3A6D|nr:PAS domain-containing protein [Geomonas sp. RF6]UFS68810.1 PAS domain-containing protein [Geomonas sp. RF6]